MSAHLYYTTRKYDWTNGQAVTLSASSASSTAVVSDEVLICSTTNVWINVGAAPTATKGAGSLFLSAGLPFHIRITSGQLIAGIQDAAAGTLTILPVL